jgi:hypothetical protein
MCVLIWGFDICRYLFYNSVMKYLLLACVAILPGSAVAKDGFIDLFNGSNLTGWHNVNGAPDTWSVKDGVIHCTGRPVCALRTLKRYENFVMELEWRHLKPGGNAGIFIWASSLAAPGQPFLRAVEVQVLDHAYGKSDWFTTHGDVFPIHGSRMKPFGRHRGMRSFPSEERSKGSPEWNHYRIECNGGTLRLHVNGKEVSGGSDCNWRRGYIGLESEGSPVEFRKIRLKELPAGDAGEEFSAPPEEGFITLYTGTSLEGWRAEGKWQSAGWQLRCTGGGSLWSEKDFGPGELVVDTKAGKGQEVGVILRGMEGTGIRWQSTGKWQRTRIEITGREVILRDAEGMEQGRVVLDAADPPAGIIALKAAADATFANIYFHPGR